MWRGKGKSIFNNEQQNVVWDLKGIIDKKLQTKPINNFLLLYELMIIFYNLSFN